MPKPNQLDDAAQPARSLNVKLAHMLLIACMVASLVSGYSAFDFAWSGVGLVNRPTYYVIHQTSGLLIPLVAIWLLVALALERPGNCRKRGLIPAGIRLFHYSLVVVVLGVSLLGLTATGCGNRPLMFLGLIPVDIPVPTSVCINGLKIFSFHQWLAGVALALAGIHAFGALFHHAVFRIAVLRAMFWPRRL